MGLDLKVWSLGFRAEGFGTLRADDLGRALRQSLAIWSRPPFNFFGGTHPSDGTQDINRGFSNREAQGFSNGEAQGYLDVLAMPGVLSSTCFAPGRVLGRGWGLATIHVDSPGDLCLRNQN